ncbi:MAG: hypothetical protein C4K60_07060 [Ideonella sp. MAG2]|nr:MAG: hypothetical protein C4K60_07060 [Ideonella sp. MAG2]
MTAQVSRAHLLLALVQRPVGHLTLEHTDQQWWGFEAQGAAVADFATQTVTLNLPAPEAGQQEPAQTRKGLPPPRNPLQMPEAWVAWNITEADAPNKEAEDDASPPLTAEELQPADEPQVAYRDLVPLPRLLPALQRHVKQHGSGGPDIKRLLQASSRRQWPTQMPHVQKSVWPQQLVLLLDCRVALYPYRFDVFRVAQAIKALLPTGQLSIYCGEHGPHGPWDEWMPGAGQGHQERFDQLPQWRNTTCLLLGDAGLLCPQPGLNRQWQAWLKAGAQAGNALVVLAPVEAHRIPGELAAVAQMLRWAPNSRFQPERGSKRERAEVGEAERAESNALAQLLACLGAVLRMDPPLLRAMRQAVGYTANPSLEGQLWARADVQATSYATLRQGGEGSAAGAGLPEAVFKMLKQNAAQHHAHWSLGMRLVDQMRQLDASPQGDAALLWATRQDLVRLASSVSDQRTLGIEARRTAAYVLRRVPQFARPWLGDALTALLESLGQSAAARRPWSLIQCVENLLLCPRDVDGQPPGCILSTEVGWASPGEPVLVRHPDRPSDLLTLPATGTLTLPLSRDGCQLILNGQRVSLRRQGRKPGLGGWERSAEGLHGTVRLPWGQTEEFDVRRDRGHRWLAVEGTSRVFEGSIRAFETSPYRFGVLLGFDEFGVYLRLGPFEPPDALTREDRMTAFRYLPPATFLMGSPDGVGNEEEHPQHPVTLTQAVWLAETPCTQALWQAVMGQNPSHFKIGPEAPQRPVENVSWDDVQQFLAKLNTLLPAGCEAVLPTEAQWEYACRAGTATAYWWGDEPDDSKANWRGQQDGTTPVDRYPPNPWGLRDMHGNVLEWCADCELRTYEAGTARDPMGEVGGDARAVRAGSWAYHPEQARSAFRSWGRRGTRDRRRNLGFRFALRSCSPQGAELQSGGLKGGGRQTKGGAATRATPKKKGSA